jgi:hypothetical protein
MTKNNGGLPPSWDISESARRPTNANFSENSNRGWGVQELGQYQMEAEGFQIVQKVVSAFLLTWSNRLDAEEIESAAMLWLTLHQRNLMESHSRAAFTSLAYKSLFRKLSHLGQEMLLDSVQTMRMGGYEVEEFEQAKEGQYKTVWNGYTTEEVLLGLECGRAEFFEFAEESCTNLQTAAILKRFKEKKEIREIADEDGRSPSAVHYLIKQGIRNIASKSIRP